MTLHTATASKSPATTLVNKASMTFVGSTTENHSMLKLGILLNDHSKILQLSQYFRAHQFMPTVYENLDMIFQQTEEDSLHCLVIDVRLMNTLTHSLIHHPLIASQKLSIIFYAPKQAGPLKTSTQEFLHLGVLTDDTPLNEQLDSCLKRFMDVHQLREHNKNLNRQILELQNDKRHQNDDQLKKFEENFYQNYGMNFLKHGVELKKHNDFHKALQTFIESIPEIQEYTAFELAPNGHHILCPPNVGVKFRQINHIWLSKPEGPGFDAKLLSMTTSMATDIMGGNLISLYLNGHSNRPQKVIFIKSPIESFFNGVDWQVVEEFLNGIYLYFQMKRMDMHSQSVEKLPNLKILDLIDQNIHAEHTRQTPIVNLSKKELIVIDFTSLFELIKKKKTMRFYFENFYSDFLSRLEIDWRKPIMSMEISLKTMGFLVDSSEADLFFHRLKEFSLGFPYGKYFADDISWLIQQVTPKVRQLPLSSYGIIDFLNEVQLNPEDLLREKLARDKANRLKTNELIWGKSRYEV